MLRKASLICGILSSLLYAAMTVFIAMQWEGYSSASQTVSELSAIGAPTRSLWLLPGALYTVMVTVFGWGVWKSADRSHSLRIVGGLIVAYGSLGLLWPFAPMHLREVLASAGSTVGDTMHIVLSGVTVLFMLLAIGSGAAAFGKRFRLYSVVTLVILFTFGGLTFLDAPRVAANLPTPWIGLWERINIGVFLLWVVVLATALLRSRDTGAGRTGAVGPHRAQGQVSHGFETVREAFADNFARRRELGGACCVYHRGEKVVDLWGGIRNKQTGEPWEQDTMVVVHSATKGLAAMTLAIAHSRGWLDYEERVCAYWPEFAQQGKERITVRQLLAHQAGLFAHRRARRSEHRRRSRSPGGRAGASETRVGARNAAGVSRAHPRVLRRRAVAPYRSAASQPGTVLPGRDRVAARAGRLTSACLRRSRTRAWPPSRRLGASRCCSASRFASRWRR